MTASHIAARAPQSLYEQLSETAHECIAVLLGFSSCEHAAGFRSTLHEMAPLHNAFTIGEAVQAYVADLTKRLDPANRSVRESADERRPRAGVSLHLGSTLLPRSDMRQKTSNASL